MALVPNINSKKTSSKRTTSKQKFTAKKKPDQSLSDRRKKKMIWAAVITFTVVLLGGLTAVSAKTMYAEGLAGKDDFDAAQTALTEQRFIDAAEDLRAAEEHLVNVQSASNKLFWMKWAPWVSTQFDAVDNLVAGGIGVASALEEVSYVADEIFSAVDSDELTISSIKPKERKAILEAINQSPERLDAARIDLAAAVKALDAIPDAGVLGVLSVAIVPIKEQLPLVEQIVDKALPFLEIAPIIVGYAEQQTYLFLLQNNTELRPTGGFIGTYGILVLENADIKEFKTDNVYNLDNQAKETLFIDPPGPINRFLGSTQWFLRDANWNPDFPTTAQKAEELYHLEGGPVEAIDGVIAVTPRLIQSLLNVTGPITVEGEEYNSENLTEKLQYEVEVGFRQDGVSDSARKEVIGTMASELMSRMMNLPKNKWGDLWTALVTDLDEKHVLIYSKDEQAQKLVEELGWGGSIEEHDSDFLMVVDANLAALKTDQVMTKTIGYELSKDGDDYMVDLSLKYYNDGIIDFFTTRYRTYTRIYVPTGSELVETSGFLNTDRFLGGVEEPASVSQDNELNKTVFEGFISVEPKSEEIITLRYKLPASVADDIESGEYSAYFQKQPGTDNVTLDASFDIGDKPKEITGTIDDVAEIDHNKVHFNSALNVDQELTIEY